MGCNASRSPREATAKELAAPGPLDFAPEILRPPPSGLAKGLRTALLARFHAEDDETRTKLPLTKALLSSAADHRIWTVLESFREARVHCVDALLRRVGRKTAVALTLLQAKLVSESRELRSDRRALYEHAVECVLGHFVHVSKSDSRVEKAAQALERFAVRVVPLLEFIEAEIQDEASPSLLLLWLSEEAEHATKAAMAWVRSIRLSHVVEKTQDLDTYELHWFTPEATLDQAMARMKSTKIHSVAVYPTGTTETTLSAAAPLALVSTLDIVGFMAKLNETLLIIPDAGIAKREKLAKHTLAEVLSFYKQRIETEVYPHECNLADVLDRFMGDHTRILVSMPPRAAEQSVPSAAGGDTAQQEQPRAQIVVLAQLDIVRFLYENKESLDESILLSSLRHHFQDRRRFRARKPVMLHKASVDRIAGDERVIEAFRRMAMERIYALAVVNYSGELVGNVSAEDLLQVGDELWDLLHLTVEYFLKRSTEAGPGHMHDRDDLPYVEVEDSPFWQLMHAMVHHRLHRIWIVDSLEHFVPTGVIEASHVIEEWARTLSASGMGPMSPRPTELDAAEEEAVSGAAQEELLDPADGKAPTQKPHSVSTPSESTAGSA